MDNKETCMSCGKPRSEITDLLGRYINHESFIQCRSCHEIEIQEKIKEFQATEPDTSFEDSVICPFCGYKHDADGEGEVFYKDGDHEFTCSYCHNEFTVSTSISISYSTFKGTL